jgi:hypothetical protein
MPVLPYGCELLEEVNLFEYYQVNQSQDLVLELSGRGKRDKICKMPMQEESLMIKYVVVKNLENHRLLARKEICWGTCGRKPGGLSVNV